MKLIAPSIEYDEQIQAYRSEFLVYGGSMDGCGSLRRFDQTQDWLIKSNHSRMLKLHLLILFR